MRDTSKDREIARTAARQHGGFVRAQIEAVGFSRSEVSWRVGAGRWLTPRDGVYAIAGTPPSREQVLWCAAAAHPGALLTEMTAGWLWRFPKADFDRIHLLTDIAGRCRFEGVVGHRSKLIVPADRRELHGIPVVSPARTIVDCSVAVSPKVLGWWMDHALRNKLCTIDDLARTVGRLRPGPGRRLKMVRALVDARIGKADRGDSQPEVKLADWLEAAGLGRPALGVVVRVNGKKLKPDALYVDEKVGFEYQSEYAHGQLGPFHDDPKRMNLLRRKGYDIYPFTSESTEADVVETIGAALRRRRAEIGRQSTYSVVS